MWWGRWRRLQTVLEYATRYNDPEVVGPLLLPVADVGDFVGIVVEVTVGEVWPEAMYAKETVAIKDLVKGLGTCQQPTNVHHSGPRTVHRGGQIRRRAPAARRRQ